MGIVGMDGNIRDISLRNIRYSRKPANNLPLKGGAFDFAPSDVQAEVPQDCGLFIRGAEKVTLENVDTDGWKKIQLA